MYFIKTSTCGGTPKNRVQDGALGTSAGLQQRKGAHKRLVTATEVTDGDLLLCINTVGAET